MQNKLLYYICLASANKDKRITINNIVHIVPKDKAPSDRFTGNLFNRFPDLLTLPPLSEKSRLNYILSPIQRSWMFEIEGKPFNFYPVFLYVTRLQVCKHTEYTPQRKMDFYDIFKIQSNYKPLNIQL